LAWVAGYVVRQFTCPKAVTYSTILTELDVEQLGWSRPTLYRYTKPVPWPTTQKGFTKQQEETENRSMSQAQCITVVAWKIVYFALKQNIHSFIHSFL